MSYFRQTGTAVTFTADRGSKIDVCGGEHLFVGLNCFEPGQQQPIHRHAGADKVYFVISGKARMTVGDETRDACAGDVVWAPADVPHGVVEAVERTVMLVAMSREKRGNGGTVER